MHSRQMRKHAEWVDRQAGAWIDSYTQRQVGRPKNPAATITHILFTAAGSTPSLKESGSTMVRPSWAPYMPCTVQWLSPSVLAAKLNE